MARDHALALSATPGRAFLRLYRWDPATLSLGRNEPAAERIDRQAVRRAGIGLVRRPTGGRSVLHHRELTYSVALALPDAGGARQCYLAINRALHRGLAHLGVAADIAGQPGGRRLPGPDAGPCFRSPAPGELVANGRKLVGSAQARIGRALLQHGSILVDDDQVRIPDLLRHDAPALSMEISPDIPPATLSELMPGPPPPWVELEDALIRGFREELAGTWTEAASRPEGETRLVERYASEAWTWRR